MLTHPTSILFFISLITSIAYTISTESWFMAWIGLEVNLLSFIPLILSKKNKYSTESALKYFLIQALGSLFIILATCLTTSTTWASLVIMMSLFLKTGAAPSHQWMPAVAEGISWPIFAILMTLQKVNPLILIFFLSKETTLHYIIILYSVTSAMIGAIGGLLQNSLRKILTYSSIAHLSWILSTLMCSSWIWLTYFLIYAFILISLIYIFELLQMSSLNHLISMNKSYLSFITSTSILSLAGLPPFTGFLPKFMALNQLINSEQAFILAPLLLGTFISLFFYVRLLLTNLLLTTHAPSTLHKTPKISYALMNMNLMGLLLPSLMIIFL
nr:TPA_asm: ND2 [Gammarus pulex]